MLNAGGVYRGWSSLHRECRNMKWYLQLLICWLSMGALLYLWMFVEILIYSKQVRSKPKSTSYSLKKPKMGKQASPCLFQILTA